MKIIGITGSLRKDSYNTWLLNAVAEMTPEGVTFQLQKIDQLCLYNEDLDNETKPEPVVSFLNNVRHADALLFATPEYNYAIPGGLKNALDWASRPAFQSPLKLKPCGIVSASKSPIGGARAQADLKNVLSSTLSPVYPAIEYLLGSAQKMFDDSGKLIDETAKRRLKRYIEGFIDWVG